MYFLLSLILGAIAFFCTVSYREFENSVPYGFIAGVFTLIISWIIMWLGQPVISISYGTWIYYMIIPAVLVLVVKGIGAGNCDMDFSFSGLVPLIVPPFASKSTLAFTKLTEALLLDTNVLEFLFPSLIYILHP